MSIFSTKSTDQADVENLVSNLDHYMPEGLANTKAIADQPIKYSRAWLILRRAYLEQNAKSLLWEPTKTATEKAHKTFGGTDPQWLERHVYGPKVTELHDEGCSWGEIMVRLGKSEGFVRKSFEACDGRKRTVGLRTGKGGRFAADRPDLYQEHRRAEGAEVPNEKGIYASNVPVEMLLNAVKEDA
jgi:hypothetical protein